MKPDNLKRNIDSLKSSSYVDRYLRPVARKVVFSKHDPEVEFMPAALEMLETPPSPAGRAIALLICVFFATAITWAYFGTVDIVATATGKIVPTGRTRLSSHLKQASLKLSMYRTDSRSRPVTSSSKSIPPSARPNRAVCKVR